MVWCFSPYMAFYLFIYLELMVASLFPYANFSMYLSLIVFPACYDRAIMLISDFCVLSSATKCIIFVPCSPRPWPKVIHLVALWTGYCLVHCPATILGFPLVLPLAFSLAA